MDRYFSDHRELTLATRTTLLLIHKRPSEHRRQFPTNSTMQLSLLLGAAFVAFLSLLVPSASATSLTYKLHANENQCFYIQNEKKASKVAFYFAVRTALRQVLRWCADTAISRFNPVARSMSTTK